MEPGQVILPHHHGQLNENLVIPGMKPTDRDLWVGVYHVEGGSDLVVEEDGKTLIAPAVPGRLAVFASNVVHKVPGPITGKRVTISMNAYPHPGSS